MVAILAAVAAAARVHAGPEADASSGHGWMLVARADGRAMLMHVPARGSGGGERGGKGSRAERGTIRLARLFYSAPQRVAWIGPEAYCVLYPESLRRQVLMTRAEPAIAGTWSYLPEGRAAAAPALPGKGQVISAVGTGEGLAALLAIEDEAGKATWRLLVLGDRAWSERALPWRQKTDGDDASAPAPEVGRCRLVSLGDRIGLVVLGGGEGDSRTLEVWESTGSGGWAIRMSAPAEVPGAADVTRASFVGAGGQVAALAWRAGALTVSLVRPGAVLKILELADVPDTAQVAALGGDGSIALVWPAETEEAGTTRAMAESLGAGVLRLRMVEVSAQTGRVLYNGMARTAGPVSARELQIVSTVLVVVTVLVGIFVLRPEPKNAPALDLGPGMELASMGVRCWASVIDLLIGAAAAAMLLGVGFEDVWDVVERLTTREGLELMVGTGLAAWVHCTAGEWLWGRSIGKRLVGCRVVRLAGVGDGEAPTAPDAGAAGAGAPDPRITLKQAALRNAMKWLPPLPLMLLVGPRRVHLGDRLAGTVVVVPAEKK